MRDDDDPLGFFLQSSIVLSVIFQVSVDGNISSSLFEFRPSIDDDDQNLRCEARNNQIPDIVQQDQWNLHVHCE